MTGTVRVEAFAYRVVDGDGRLFGVVRRCLDGQWRTTSPDRREMDWFPTRAKAVEFLREACTAVNPELPLGV